MGMYTNGGATDRSWLTTELIGEAMPRPENTFKCRNCNDIGFEIDEDPYDVVSGSPIVYPVQYCLKHYNERVLAAFKWIGKHGYGRDKL